MPAKKKIVKRKPTKPRAGQVIKQTVTVNVGSKAKSKSRGKAKKKMEATPPEYRQSSGYILPSVPSWQLNPSAQPQFQKPESNQLLIDDMKRQFPLLAYSAQQQYQPRITQGETSFAMPEEDVMSEYSIPAQKPVGIEEIPQTEYSQSGGFSRTPSIISEAPPITLVPPSAEKQKKPKGGTAEDIAKSKAKLEQYGFPDTISRERGLSREADITTVVELMINANKQGANISAADLHRVYGIDGTTVKNKKEKITGISQPKREKSKIPNPREYNLV